MMNGVQKNKKRTRTLSVRQSSGGCLTCKIRRIKCDETKPVCFRCQRSKRHCAGYAYDGFQSHNSNESSSPLPQKGALSYAGSYLVPRSLAADSAATELGFSSWQRSLSRLGCDVLGADPHCIYSFDQSLFWSVLLSQCSNSIPFVASAVTAFGSAYATNLLSNKASVRLLHQTRKLYTDALHLLQKEIGSARRRYLPILIASMLLAAYEIVMGRRRDAMIHVFSAFAIFSDRANLSAQCKKEVQMAGGNQHSIDHMLRSLDYLIIAFVRGRRPLLRSNWTERGIRLRNLDELVNQHPIILHESLSFFGEAHQDYDDGITGSTAPYGPTATRSSMLLKQGKVIALLTRWLDVYNNLLGHHDGLPLSPPGRDGGTLSDTQSNTPSSSRLRHLAVLKFQCLGALVAVSTMTQRSQQIFDNYIQHFAEMVSCARYALQPTPSTGSAYPACTVSSTAAAAAAVTPFSPACGVIQSLAYTARKCRDPQIRRDAIYLLLRAGNEGPFVGRLEALLGSRIVEIEEGRPFSPLIDVHDNGTMLRMEDISDEQRVSTCWRASQHTKGLERFGSIVKFARRRRRRGTPGPRNILNSDIQAEAKHQTPRSYEQTAARASKGGKSAPNNDQQDEWELEMWQEDTSVYNHNYDDNANANANTPLHPENGQTPPSTEGIAGRQAASPLVNVIDSNDPALWRLLPFETRTTTEPLRTL